MRNILLIIFVWIVSPVTPLLSQPDHTATLEIEMKGIRSGKGQIAIGLSRSPEEWPHDPSLDYTCSKEELKEGTLIFRISSLEQGTYAIAVLDDENFNQKMDSFLGIPREGYGFSRNPSTRLGRPSFEECAINVDRPFQKITIELRYTGKDREPENEKGNQNRR